MRESLYTETLSVRCFLQLEFVSIKSESDSIAIDRVPHGLSRRLPRHGAEEDQDSDGDEGYRKAHGEEHRRRLHLLSHHVLLVDSAIYDSCSGPGIISQMAARGEDARPPPSRRATTVQSSSASRALTCAGSAGFRRWQSKPASWGGCPQAVLTVPSEGSEEPPVISE